MNKVKENVLNFTLRRVVFQKYFEFLFKASLAGMNIGGGSDYETSGEISVIKNLAQTFPVHEKTIIFDVGANIGGYTQMLERYCPKNTIIYSFEPSLASFTKMKRNIGKCNRIKLYNFGFSNKEGKVVLHSNKKGSELASLYRRRLNHFGIEMKNREFVQLMTIDSFCNENKIKRINLLKIDVEGHELNVLRGARKMLNSKRIDNIQFEFGGCNIDSRTFLQDFFYLFGNDYQIYRVVRNGVYNLGSYKEYYECFETTNYLVILKHDKS